MKKLAVQYDKISKNIFQLSITKKEKGKKKEKGTFKL